MDSKNITAEIATLLPVKNAISILLLNSFPANHHRKKQKHWNTTAIVSDTNICFLIYRSTSTADRNSGNSSIF